MSLGMGLGLARYRQGGTVDPVAPDAPTWYDGAIFTDNGFTLNWDPVSGAVYYKLDIATDAEFTSFVSGYEDLTESETSKEVSGLDEDTTYYCRVRTWDGVLISENSETQANTTLMWHFIALPMTYIDNDKFTVNWRKPDPNEEWGTDYWLYAYEVADIVDFSNVIAEDNINNNTETVSVAINGLSSETQYWFRVGYRIEAPVFDWSNVVTATTKA